MFIVFYFEFRLLCNDRSSITHTPLLFIVRINLPASIVRLFQLGKTSYRSFLQLRGFPLETGKLLLIVPRERERETDDEVGQEAESIRSRRFPLHSREHKNSLFPGKSVELLDQ